MFIDNTSDVCKFKYLAQISNSNLNYNLKYYNDEKYNFAKDFFALCPHHTKF